MSSDTLTLKSFFDRYARASVGSDSQALAKHYASEFIVSSREGSAAFKNDEKFLTWLRSVFDFNRKAGMQSLKVATLRDTAIGDAHALVTVEWATTFQKTGAERICFEISYLVRLAEDRPLILAYVPHENQEQMMKARGLI